MFVPSNPPLPRRRISLLKSGLKISKLIKFSEKIIPLEKGRRRSDSIVETHIESSKQISNVTSLPKDEVKGNGYDLLDRTMTYIFIVEKEGSRYCQGALLYIVTGSRSFHLKGEAHDIVNETVLP